MADPSTPQRPDRRLATHARLAEDPARLFEVVAEQPVVAIEGRDRETPPFPVGYGATGRGIDRLHDGPVLVHVPAQRLLARAADEGVALGAAALERRLVAPALVEVLLQPHVLAGSRPNLVATSQNRPTE